MSGSGPVQSSFIEDVNLYQILGLPTPSPDTTPPTTEQIKAAYRRALLRHHPDKSSGRPGERDDAQRVAFSAGAQTVDVTVDQVRHALDVLTSPARRREHDQRLKLSHSRGPGSTSSHRTTELDEVDLDELDYDSSTCQYFRACRCGNARGFLVGEDDLLGGDDGSAVAGEVLLECPDCSHHLRVTYQLVEDDDDATETDA